MFPLIYLVVKVMCVNKMRMTWVFLALSLIGMAVATSGLNNLSTALTNLCSGVKSLIPIVAFLLIVSAGVVYAAGQLLGAETRARASVWATAMLIGAIIGLLIVVVTPNVLEALYGQGSFSC